jgi:hypothetical protein
MQATIQAIADHAVHESKHHLFAQHPVVSAAQTLRRNFTNIIGTITHCPRCFLRDGETRWFPERQGEWQTFDCPNCGYSIKER